VEIERTVVATIAGMAVLTYLTRAGGVWLAGRVAQPERLEAWLQPVPGALLAAIVASAAVDAGWRGLVGLAVVVCVMARWGNLLLAAGVGTALIVVLRW
jgi:branched chain amino acid efflux pump